MALLEWSDKYSVAIESIDNQHKKLVDMLNRLHDAMTAGKGRDVCGPILNDLASYTKTHFAYEERLFDQHAYAHRLEHKAEHDALTSQVLKFKADYEQGRATLSVELSAFLKKWLVSHIAGSDTKYSPYLLSKGVK